MVVRATGFSVVDIVRIVDERARPVFRAFETNTVVSKKVTGRRRAAGGRHSATIRVARWSSPASNDVTYRFSSMILKPSSSLTSTLSWTPI